MKIAVSPTPDLEDELLSQKLERGFEIDEWFN